MHRSKLIVFLLLRRFIFLIIINFGVFLLPASNLRAQNQSNEYRIKKVVIDAGHGGKDSGARGKTAMEKDIALGVALKLGKYIENNIEGVDVLYTRKKDIFIPLYKRGDFANKADADLFISIHANSFPNNQNVSGAETYVMGLHTDERNFDVAKKENSVITFEEDYTSNYEGFDPNSAESYIIFSLMQNTFLNQSAEFAAMIQNEFRNKAQRRDRGVRQAGFVVLWQTTMPSVLVETGYVSNPKEEKYLSSATGQEYLASAIFRAFRDYKLRIESRSHFTHAAPEESIYFKVQIASSVNQMALKAESFKNYKEVEEFHVGKWYKYAVGKSYDYDDIVTFSKEVRKKVTGAFVIAVKDGEIIPLNEALRNK
ncbi:MAG: N-acetylmuramoyl-L-alanine amidase [Bacteroidales bacterium]|nr:N-acetylmuramoyl-L-alanine amidase [Bacteroidales bacterium]